jgi:ABC-2 type transport system ATP-binding protein
MPVIEVSELRKEYPAVTAVDGISFSVDAGEIYALLGHNGAGKTTTVEILEGHRRRTSGVVEVLGIDPATRARDLRDRTGIVLQTSGIEPEFTVREALDIYGGVYRRRRPSDEVLALVGLDEQAEQRIGSLSGGQRRRIDLALGIVGWPELLYLDEPTTGFDPAARRAAWALIESLVDDGVTVVLTTHYLEEAERLADRVGIIARGRLVAEGPPSELTARIGTTRVEFELPDGVAAADLGDVVPDAAEVTGQHVEFVTASPTGDVHGLTSWAVERGIELDRLAVSRSTLEDVFLQLGADGGSEDEFVEEPEQPEQPEATR